MQFQYNGDYPGVNSTNGTYEAIEALDPPEFPPAQPLPCARITTRIYHPARQQVATVQNVLVRTSMRPQPHPRSDSNSDIMTSSSSDSDDDDDVMDDTDDQGNTNHASSNTVEPRAYWIQRTIREAIYGKVMSAIVLEKRGNPVDNAEWEVTDKRCAVKEMSWQHIRRERSRLAEDPIKEVAAMQYLKQWHELSKRAVGLDGNYNSVDSSFQAMKDTNIMMPLDLLSDDRNLYSVMPFCEGGELFERLDMNERFTEGEARYWMNQVLNGLENLQRAGITHRDMSLENMLVHESGALIIDMGMCLRVPMSIPAGGVALPTELSKSFGYMSLQGGATAASMPNGTAICLNAKQQPRHTLKPQGTCGKWIYMSPEVFRNKEPFDGYAVDMWAAGVILFLMLTGFPPWERASQTDERFKYMTAGYLVQMLTEWNIGLSSDAMDLLQRMLFLDPKDRLCLEQVRSHPWMVNGPSVRPQDFRGF